MNKEEALKQFGLTEKEIKVFLANLDLGTSLVQDISKKAGTYRTYTYEVLKSLKEKGLVSYVIKSGKQYFEPVNPNKLISLLKEKENAMKQILPELNSIYQATTEKPRIEVFEGKEGLKTLLSDMLNEKKEILNLASSKKVLDILEFDFPKFIIQRVKLKIPARILTEKTSSSIKHKKEGRSKHRELRFLPNNKAFTNATFIYGDKVAIMSLHENYLGILIKNKEIANNWKLIFNLLWKLSNLNAPNTRISRNPRNVCSRRKYAR